MTRPDDPFVLDEALMLLNPTPSTHPLIIKREALKRGFLCAQRNAAEPLFIELATAYQQTFREMEKLREALQWD